MSITNTFTFGHSGGDVSLADTVAEVAAVAQSGSFTVAGSTTNQQEGFSWTNANLRGVYLKSDQTLTLKTNSTGSPQDTLTITAGVPFVWVFGSGITNPFAGNVTQTFWTNGGATLANVYVRVLSS